MLKVKKENVNKLKIKKTKNVIKLLMTVGGGVPPNPPSTHHTYDLRKRKFIHTFYEVHSNHAKQNASGSSSTSVPWVVFNLGPLGSLQPPSSRWSSTSASQPEKCDQNCKIKCQQLLSDPPPPRPPGIANMDEGLEICRSNRHHRPQI
jgi:hypothetical protein